MGICECVERWARGLWGLKLDERWGEVWWPCLKVRQFPCQYAALSAGVESRSRRRMSLGAGMLINSRAAHQPSHSWHSPLPEGASERAKERHREVRGPMSRHWSSHNTTDTNPGSVPLAPDCHKSDEASQQDGGRRPKREVKKPQPHSTDQTERRGTKSNLWTEETFISTDRVHT